MSCMTLSPLFFSDSLVAGHFYSPPGHIPPQTRSIRSESLLSNIVTNFEIKHPRPRISPSPAKLSLAIYSNPNEELFNACRDGHVDMVRNAIRKGANVNHRWRCMEYKWGKTPLMIACENGHSEIAKILIAKGANLEATKNWGGTPLMIACENGHSEIAIILIDEGANLEATDYWTRIALETLTKFNVYTTSQRSGWVPHLDLLVRNPMVNSNFCPPLDLLVRNPMVNSNFCPPLDLLVRNPMVNSNFCPPLDLLVRNPMVNSNFWVMEADMWADLSILARWSNPTFDREQVICNLCNGVWLQPATTICGPTFDREQVICILCKVVWVQPATTFCGHTFCSRCLMNRLKNCMDCPKCGKVVDREKIMKFNEAAESLLSNYKAEQHVSDEEWVLFIGAKKHCTPPPLTEDDGVSCDLPLPKPKKRERDFESESPETKRRKLSHDTSKDGPTVLKVNTHLLHVKRAIREARPRWKDIGRGLDLLDGTIESIHEEDDEERLHKVLSLWMQTNSATIYQLLEALEKPPVGRKDIAGEIRSLKGEERSRVGLGL